MNLFGLQSGEPQSVMQNEEAVSQPSISLRPVGEDDLEFLFRLYASTRMDELAVTGWDAAMIEYFLRMQFNLQHSQYLSGHPGASFDLVYSDAVPAGRLYVKRTGREIRIIDIALLPEFRAKGIGSRLMRKLVAEADATGCMMSLHVEMNNPILSFYRSLGFREIELREIYYYMERGQLPEGVRQLSSEPQA